MRQLRFHLLAFLAGCALVSCLLTRPASAQFPPGPADDQISSMGAFIIWVEPDYRSLVDSEPGWNFPSPNHWTSPAMIDPGTVVGRSNPHQDNDATDTGGAVVGAAATMVKDSDFAAVPAVGFSEGPAGTEEVHTEIFKLRLEEPSCRFTIRVGTGAGVAQASFGEVEDNNPNPPVFPAESFFTVFLEMDTPFFGGSILHNRPTDPLLIVNNMVKSLPPHVVYIHGESSAVPIYFKDGPEAGKRFGFLRLAGHGAQFSCHEQEIIPQCPSQPFDPDTCADDDTLLGEISQAVQSGRMMDCADCSATDAASPAPEGIPLWMIILILVLLVLILLLLLIRRP